MHQGEEKEQEGRINQTSQPLEDQSKRDAWVPKKLNWTQILYDQNIFIDAESYRKWDRNLHFDGQQLLDKDLYRTRSSQPYFLKKPTQQLLKRITTFYCVYNRIHYQQGLLEVVIPFALLKRPDFETRKCYAYFNSFMRKYFPKVLTQKTIQNKKQLPHAILAINLVQILLKYHFPLIYQTFQSQQIPLSMVVTQQLLTVFAKNVQLPLVYEIFNFFMNKKNKNYIIYMCIALIGLRQKQIYQNAENDMLHIFVNKDLKNFKERKDLDVWFRQCQEIESKTPKSFELLSKKLGFCDKSFFTIEDYERMMNFQENFIDFIMPAYRQEIDESPDNFLFVIAAGQAPSSKYNSIRVSLQIQKGEVVCSQYHDLCIKSKKKVLVFGYCRQKENTEKEGMIKLIKKLNKGTKYSGRVRIFPEKLQERKTCQIY